jgi:predicted RNA-binding protein (virulence factor B family)
MGFVEDLLGQHATLRVARMGAHGALLQIAPETPETVLLPRAEVPDDVRENDEIEVFVYLDSQDRPVATTSEPRLTRDQVAFLEVRDVTRFGAFLDWGLRKDLLVPFAEQTRELKRGDYEPVGLGLDQSGRLYGTMRIRELLQTGGRFEVNEWVEGEAWRHEPGVGVFVILEKQYLGLLPEHEPHRLQRGEPASFRITNVYPDGKVELSLRGLGHEELAWDAQRILDRLKAPDCPRLSDHSSPEQIRELFGLSKKAFKRALGRLLKTGAVSMDDRGFFRAE